MSSLKMPLDETFTRFSNYVNNRLQQHFAANNEKVPAEELPEIYSTLFKGKKLNHCETIILLTALAAHVQPTLFDNAIQPFMPKGGEFPEFGGVKGTNTRYMLPTGDTALFLLAGTDTEKRTQVLRYFDSSHWFWTDYVLWLEHVKEGEPRTSGKLILQQEYVDLLTTGLVAKPAFSPEFPAKLVTTKMEWEDVILPAKTATQIDDIKIWLHHNVTFLQTWGMEKRIKPGFRALFYGPPGTGKTLTATLLGKQFEKDVYRVDLSQVVSKYIGETEKNLEKIFIKAENKNWILFFDEADALFGKRSNVQNAHDKYANQEVSYLLQRVEDFSGLVILASNYKSNIDQAFIRRFNSIIHFSMPNQAERHAIWKAAIPTKATLAKDIDLIAIAAKYEISGSAIVSVIHYASLQTIYKNSTSISKPAILEGIKREFEKEERVFNA
jgi:hypothetical protein